MENSYASVPKITHLQLLNGRGLVKNLKNSGIFHIASVNSEIYYMRTIFK